MLMHNLMCGVFISSFSSHQQPHWLLCPLFSGVKKSRTMSQLHTGLLGCSVINRMQNSVCFDVRCIGGRDRIDLLQVEKQTEAMKVKMSIETAVRASITLTELWEVLTPSREENNSQQSLSKNTWNICLDV